MNSTVIVMFTFLIATILAECPRTLCEKYDENGLCTKCISGYFLDLAENRVKDDLSDENCCISNCRSNYYYPGKDGASTIEYLCLRIISYSK